MGTETFPPPNLHDYDAVRADFTWEKAAGWLDGLPGGGRNIAYEAVDRHLVHGNGGRIALRCLSRDGTTTEVSYGDLARRSAAFAHVLRDLGVGPGDRVFSLLGRVPQLYAAMLGTFKARSVFAPLFSAFGPEPVRQRMVIGSAEALVTTAALYRKKVAPIRDEVPSLQHVLLLDRPGTDVADIPGALFFDELLAAAPTGFEIEPTDPEEMALLHFTSGTTGTPEGRGARALARSSPTTPAPSTRSTCTPATSTGAPPTPAG